MREESIKRRKDKCMKGQRQSNNAVIATLYDVISRRTGECRDGARTVSSSAKKRIKDVFDYVRGDGKLSEP
jgi:hypothetical protein